MAHDDAHYFELDRLWRLCRRDFNDVILAFAGVHERGKAYDRLSKNWARLCELDIDVAASLYHGVEQLWLLMARHDEPDSPAERGMQHLEEVVGMVTIGREANPDAEALTVGELLELGEQAIRGEIDKETGGPESAETD